MEIERPGGKTKQQEAAITDLGSVEEALTSRISETSGVVHVAEFGHGTDVFRGRPRKAK